MLAGCAVLGQLEHVGRWPHASVGAHLLILLSLVGILHWFPSVQRPSLLIFALAICARGLCWPLDISDDVYRYIWEGRIQHFGFNPYQLAPAAPSLYALRDATFPLINHPELTAIYPPGALLFFRALTSLSQSVLVMKVVFVLADLGTLGLILTLLKQVGRKPEWGLLYAINPVVLISFSGEAHLDALMTLCTTAALTSYHTKRWKSMFFCLALSCHVKYVAVLLLPFLITRDSAQKIWVFVVTLVLPFLWFVPWSGLFTSLRIFSSDMHFNGSIQPLLAWLVGSHVTASWIGLGLLMGAWGIVRAVTPRPLEGGLWCTAFALAVSSNVHFWYLTWLTPFLCFYPVRTGLLFCGTISLTYFTYGHFLATDVWKEFTTATLVEYLPVYALLLWDMRSHGSTSVFSDNDLPSAVRSVSVVVPTMNEEVELPTLLDNLATMHPPPLEVIVADAGSTDRTVSIAEARGARIVSSPKGRGIQMANGIDKAKGDVVFLAHADMRIEPGAFARICDALNSTGKSGGCLGCRFDQRHPFLSFVTFLNNTRARISGIAFGDQGQFLRRSHLRKLGGFPRQAIMEDVEFSLRLKSLHTPLFLGGGVVASSRKWSTKNKSQHALLIVRLVLAYLWVRSFCPASLDLDAIYRSYYEDREAA